MKKFKRNTKVFVVVEEYVVRGRIVRAMTDEIIQVVLDGGKTELVRSEDVFSRHKDAVKVACSIWQEHEELNDEARYEAAQAYYADIMEQLPSLI